MQLLSVANEYQHHVTLQDLLVEANVYNLKADFNGVSLAKYIETYASQLGTPEAKTVFTKKLTTLLINDPKYHHAMREVPDNAPDWAKKAVAEKQLVAFVPNVELNGKMEHLMHYMAGAEQDAKQTTNRDQQVFAQREIQGFIKAENLDLLVKKSQEFFTRGTRNVKRDDTGMTKVYDAGNNYIWYKLDSAAAYQREGKVLQNCIGRNYTPASSAENNQAILIMRDGNNNSVVAARIKHREGNQWELEEVKGKQNRPPAGHYMPPTIKLINNMHFTPSSGAKHDLKNAGYYFYDNIVYSKEEAIQKLLKTEPMDKLSYGLTLVKIASDSLELLNDLYSLQNTLHKNYGWAPEGWKDVKLDIYEGRRNNTPIVSFIVDSAKRVLVQIMHYSGNQPVAESIYEDERHESTVKNAVIDIFGVLHRKGIIVDVAPAINSEFFWHEGLSWNATTHQLERAAPDEKHEFPEHDSTWNQYSKKDIVKQIKSSFEDKYHSKEIAKARVKSFFTIDQTRQDILGIAETIDGDILPFEVFKGEPQGSDRSRVGFKKIENAQYSQISEERDEKVVHSLIALANKKQLNIPTAVRASHGILRDNAGKYTQYKLKPVTISENPKTIKYDFDDVQGENQQIAAQYAFHEAEIKAYNLRSSYYNNIDKLIASFPISSIYTVQVTYGVEKEHRVTLVCSGTRVVHLDEATKEHKWQNWDDYEVVAAQLNKLCQQQGLTPDIKSTSRSEEFRVRGRQFVTKEQYLTSSVELRKERGTAGTEGVNEITFKDGSKMVRMEPQKQAQWQRQDLKSFARGEAWQAVNAQGTTKSIVIVDKGKVTKIASNAPTSEKPEGMPSVTSTIDAWILPRLKTAAQQFKWTIDNNQISMTPDSKALNALRPFADKPRKRMYLSHNETSAIALGMLTATAKQATATGNAATHRTVSITPLGKSLLASADKNKGQASKINVLDHIGGESTTDDFKIPEKQPEPEKVQTPGVQATGEVSAPRTGSKADLALQKFKEITKASGAIPTRSVFMKLLAAAPFNMSGAGAQTYYYTTKAKYARLVNEGVVKDGIVLEDKPLVFSLLKTFIK